MLELGLSLVFAYLIGSINFSLALGRFRNLDVREVGSGNAGATNALRAAGLPFAAAVLAGDIGKALLAVGPLALLAHALAPEPAFSLAWIQAGAAAAVTAAHCYPLWHEFRGGKGFATLLGACLVLHWPLAAAMLGVWALILVLTGYVAAATMLAAISAPLVLAFAMTAAGPELLWLASAAAAFILWTHRSNIRELLNGTERRFDRVRVIHWLKKEG
ncbi:MAG: glycerol-3-phosphate 1-O-acyltransferase PlsY [Gammaproteobacteria bacterium]|nr:glycerol-3-phosphate 1-O-acyltransferase PlsY [Gammaproteobacteria bacterium]